MLTAVALRADPAVMARLGGPSRTSGDSLRSRIDVLLTRVGRIRGVRLFGRPDRLAGRLAAAGWDVSLEWVLGAKAAVALGVLLIAVSAPPLRLVAPILAVACFLAPDITAGRAAKARRAMADAEVPAFLDLLAAGSMAGLAAPLSLRRAADGVRGPLADELQGAAAAVELGGRWRDELRVVAERLALPDLRRAVTAITRTEVLGSSLADTIRELADDVRDDRRNRAAEQARKAPVKMLFPLVFMILPAFLLLTVVPVLLSTLRSIR